jgi:hypothetical protein
MNNDNDPILTFFSYAHLPAYLQTVSKPFHDLAHALAVDTLPEHPQRAVALQRLLEAKDAAVRCAVKW